MCWMWPEAGQLVGVAWPSNCSTTAASLRPSSTHDHPTGNSYTPNPELFVQKEMSRTSTPYLNADLAYVYVSTCRYNTCIHIHTTHTQHTQPESPSPSCVHQLKSDRTHTKNLRHGCHPTGHSGSAAQIHPAKGRTHRIRCAQ